MVQTSFEKFCTKNCFKALGSKNVAKGRIFINIDI